jgi:phosphatidylinositol dimannoside acyltransferase
VSAAEASGGAAVTARETPKQRLAYWTYRSAEALGSAMPDAIGRPAARLLGGVGARLLPGVYATVAANQARVLGVEPESALARLAAREAFELYARYWYDTFRVRAIADEDVLRRTTSNGLEHIDAALENGKGVICALPHMGNWDAAGRWLSVLGYRIAAVAEVLQPPRLFELFLRHREELGMRVVPLAGGTGRRLGTLLSENWIVALVADRDLTGRGVEVEMFGAPRRIPAGPALLSLSSGAPLLPCALYTTPTGWHVEISPPVDVPRTGERRADATAIAGAIACHFERVISAHPADWHLFQPGWPA